VWSGDDGVELPTPGNALEFVFAAIVEHEAGSSDEIRDRPRHEHLAWLGDRLHPRGEIDRDAPDVIAALLDLAGVDADS